MCHLNLFITAVTWRDIALKKREVIWNGFSLLCDESPAEFVTLPAVGGVLEPAPICFVLVTSSLALVTDVATFIVVGMELVRVEEFLAAVVVDAVVIVPKKWRI